jgi:iron complex transport system ATP-binding protein
VSLCADSVAVRRGSSVLLEDVSVAVRAGELLVVVGPNGAGKSTLLRLLAGDMAPDAGEVTLAGESLAAIDLERRAALRAVVGPPPRMAFDYTVADVVAMGWLHGDRYGRAVRERALATVLRDCDLEGLGERVFMSLSSGEQQRAQFARGRLQLWRDEADIAARWLLLDEPNANLDVAHGLALLEDLKALAAGGVGVLAVLHDLDLAARFADRILLLERGRIAAAGRPGDVMTPAILSRVYGTPIHVEHHAALGRLVVIA